MTILIFDVKILLLFKLLSKFLSVSYKISFLQKVNETTQKEILNPEKNLISFKHLND